MVDITWSGLGRVERGGHRLAVAHFADQDTSDSGAGRGAGLREGPAIDADSRWLITQRFGNKTSIGSWSVMMWRSAVLFMLDHRGQRVDLPEPAMPVTSISCRACA
jgi:hypothetical protein